MRCVIGCGCGKSRKPGRGQRLKTAQIRKIQAQRKKVVVAKKPQKLSDLVNQRNSAICMSCEQSKQTKLERKRGIRVCHKSSRLVTNVIRDAKFSCPIGKWKKVK